MQNPHGTRYYITKSGGTPTVRSVKVALADSDSRNDGEKSAAAAEASLGQHPAASTETAVKRRVKDVIRRGVER